MNELIASDMLQGSIRNPFAFVLPIQRGYSGPVGTLGLCMNLHVTASFSIDSSFHPKWGAPSPQIRMLDDVQSLKRQDNAKDQEKNNHRNEEDGTL